MLPSSRARRAPAEVLDTASEPPASPSLPRSAGPRPPPPPVLGELDLVNVQGSLQAWPRFAKEQTLPRLVVGNMGNLRLREGRREVEVRAAVEDAWSIATRLALRPDDVVLVRHGSCVEGVVCVLAAILSGCALLPLSPTSVASGLPLDHAMTVHSPSVVLSTVQGLSEAEYSMVRLRVRVCGAYAEEVRGCAHWALDLSAQRPPATLASISPPAVDVDAPALICSPLVFSQRNVACLAWSLKDESAEPIGDLDSLSILSRLLPRLCFGSGVVDLYKPVSPSVRRPGMVTLPSRLRSVGPSNRTAASLAAVFLEAASYRLLAPDAAVTCTLRLNKGEVVDSLPCAKGVIGILLVSGPGMATVLQGDTTQMATRYWLDNKSRLWFVTGETCVVGEDGQSVFLQHRAVRHRL